MVPYSTQALHQRLMVTTAPKPAPAKHAA